MRTETSATSLIPEFQASSKIQARADAPNQAGKNEGVELGRLVCMNCWKLWKCLACIRATTATTAAITITNTIAGLLVQIVQAEVLFVRDIFVFGIVRPIPIEQTEWKMRPQAVHADVTKHLKMLMQQWPGTQLKQTQNLLTI